MLIFVYVFIYYLSFFLELEIPSTTGAPFATPAQCTVQRKCWMKATHRLQSIEARAPRPPSLHPSLSEQRGSPLPAPLFPLRCVPSPCAVIKTTGGTRNAAWLLPACNRHHLVHKEGLPPPRPTIPHLPRCTSSSSCFFQTARG